MTSTIQGKEIMYFSREFGNASSQLFWLDKQVHLGVTAIGAGMVTNVLESGLLGELAREGYILPVEPSANMMENFSFVLKVRGMPRISYCYEWCSPMWKAAALHVLDLMLVLAESALTLEKPHPWNVLFDHGKPVYVHPGSIVPFSLESVRRSYETLCRFLIRPLLLSEAGFGHAARQLLHDVHDGVTGEDCPVSNAAWTVWAEPKTTKECEEFLRSIRTNVTGVETRGRRTKFADYYTSGIDCAPPSTYKSVVVERLLDDLRPTSVVDVASNAGLYPRLASRRGYEVVAMDLDESCVCRLFEAVSETKEHLLPLVMDFTNPSPGYGVCNDWFPSATCRLKGDLVLGLAVEHHFVFGRHRLTFEQIARGFASFCSRSLLVEFVPAGEDTNANPNKWRPESEAWYNLDCFADAFGREFRRVNVLPPSSESPRRLLFCQDLRTRRP